MTSSRRLALAALTVIGLAAGGCATAPGSSQDAATAAWWRTTQALSGDAMEGRDVGSNGYVLAAAYVAERFAAAGLVPAGDHGGWFQAVPMHEVFVAEAGTRLIVRRDDGVSRELQFLHEVSVTPTEGMLAAIDAPIAFRGYCAAADMTDVAGKVVVCFGARRAGTTTGAQRSDAANGAGAVAIVTVDDAGFDLEPPRWPVAYARSVSFAGAPPGPARIPALRLAAAAFADLVQGAGQSADAILAAGAASRPLPSFDVPARLEATFSAGTRDYVSSNVLGVLPGTDSALADQVVLVGAHLDGYGRGTPVNGDDLYNGALDDAAYVATLIEMADHRGGRGWRRPVLFAAFTGEEKGLLGSRWLADHPQPTGQPVAMLNLDQLRPLYPLTILTTLAVDDTSLGQTAREIAGEMGVEVRPDREPERGLLRRSDHWPFMQKGVPGISFIFGYDPGTEAERRYRDWYMTRYHLPADDLTTPIDWKGAADFNRFYETLTGRVADADAAPTWDPDSPLRPGANP